MRPGDEADPLLPPTSGVSFTTATSPKRFQARQHLPSPNVSTPETETESPAEYAAAQLLPTSGYSSATTAPLSTITPAPASPATQQTPLPAQATNRALGALPMLHLHPPTLFQVVLLLSKNTTQADTYYGYCSGTQTVSQQNSIS